ncbi:MAG: ShlB/FhaC/HecB family hemolysin secretion/activation protein [Candidatus Omnitrophica bacterium]|nr:ShlB/FhaC/HecB family hemolysin secretion/activation protein [Candidatus Omnitrophota bacterium]
MFFQRKLRAIVFLLAFGLTLPAMAQQVPGSAKSGVVERNIKTPDMFREPLATEATPTVAKTAKEDAVLRELDEVQASLTRKSGKHIVVSHFRFSGNTVFTGIYLEDLLSSYKNKPIDFQDLQVALAIVNKKYASQGYFLARAILPTQEITNGIVEIQIVEGHLGEVIVEGGRFYKADFIRDHFPCATNGIINYNALLKSIILLNEYPDLDVKVILQKGKNSSTTDTVLKVQDRRPLHFFSDYNNFGSRYVARHQMGTGAVYSNLIVGGDKISINEVHGLPFHRMTYVNTEYSLPINAYGTRFGISYGWSEFDVQKEFRALDSGGRSQTVSLELRHPLQRTLTSNADLLFGFDAKDSRNYLLGHINSVDRLRIVKVGVSGDAFDSSLKGRNYFSALLSKGVANTFGASGHDNPLSSRAGAGGALLKANFDLARYQRLPMDSVLLLKLSTQMADDVLPVSEQLAIGGENSVRGYPESEHLGDYGGVLNLELTAPLPFWKNYKLALINKELKDFLKLVGFFDYGKVYLKNPQVGEAKSHQIAGSGFGFRFDFNYDLNMLLDFGFPVAGDKSSSGDKEVTYLQVIKKF